MLENILATVRAENIPAAVGAQVEEIREELLVEGWKEMAVDKCLDRCNEVLTQGIDQRENLQSCKPSHNGGLSSRSLGNMRFALHKYLRLQSGPSSLLCCHAKIK